MSLDNRLLLVTQFSYHESKCRCYYKSRILVTLTFHNVLLFSKCFSKRLFSKISQIFQLTLARVFISVKNDVHINIWQLNSLSKVLQRSFQGKLSMTIEICFTSTWISTINITREKIEDKGFSYSKRKSKSLI